MVENKKIKYNKSTGWIQERYPWDEPATENSGILEVSEEEYQQTLSCDTGKRWAVNDNHIILLNYETNESKKLEKMNAISSINSWFNSYDMQIKQAERAQRLGEPLDIHIGNTIYTSIEDLDKEAKEKAAELKKLSLTMQ